MGYRGNEGTYETANLAHQDEDVEMICCPELDKEGYGRPNFPLKSCLHRQQDTEWKVPTCYGGCKGRRPLYTQPKTPVPTEARQKAAQARVLEAQAIRDKVVELKQQGMSIEDIALAVNRGKSLVEKRLLEAGMIENKFVHGVNSLKQQIMRWLDDHPEAKTRDIMEAYPSTLKGTCESYLTQWKRRKKYQ